MTCPISVLPEEMICHILSFINSKRCLSNLSSCSKSLHQTVLPFLFRHLEYDTKQYGGIPYFPHLRGLTSLFLHKPEYASFVRHLTMRNTLHGDNYFGYKQQNEDFIIDTVEVEEVLETTIKASSHSNEEATEWLHYASYKTSSDALMAILLPLLNRLEKLDIMLGDNLKYFKRTLSRIGAKEKPFDTKSALTTLTDVTLTCHNMGDGRGMEPTFLSLFIYLPAIKAVYAYYVGGYSPLAQPARFRRQGFSYGLPQD